MGRFDRDLHDWRAWPLLVATAGVAIGDILLPAQVVLLPFLVIPLIASAALGRPGFTGLLVGLAVALGIIAITSNDYAAADSVRRIVVLTVSGAIAVGLAWLLRRDRERLEERADLLRLVAENASDVVYLVGPDGLVTWMAPSVTAALGYSPEELLASSVFDLVHPDDRAGVGALRADLFSGRRSHVEPTQVSARFRRADGTYRWLAIRSTAVHAPDGSLLRIVTGLHDVDDVVQQRDLHAEVAQILAATVEAVGLPVLVVDVVGAQDVVTAFDLVTANAAALSDLELAADTPPHTRISAGLRTAERTALCTVLERARETENVVVLDDFPVERGTDARVRHYDVRAQRINPHRVCVLWRDVTERYLSATSMAASEEAYRLLATNTVDVVALVQAGIVRWISPSVTVQLGWSPEDWVGRPATGFVHPDDVAVTVDHQEAAQTGTAGTVTVRLRDRSGGFHWVEIHGGPFLGPDGIATGSIASFHVVDREIEAMRELQDRARHDELTGLLGRTEGMIELGRVLDEPPRAGTRTAVMFCDLDGFKQINDTHGHEIGDRVLRTVANRLRATVRASDVVARLGGDEFVVVAAGVADADHAATLAEKIRTSVRRPIAIDVGVEPVRVGISIGIALAEAGEPAAAVVARADAAMYRAKQDGRDRVRVDVGAP